VKNPSGSDAVVEFVLTWRSLEVDRRGVTALEYGLIAGVIVAVIMLGFTSLASALSNQFTTIGDGL
jgi:Flp pilus assembly pilin Flp